MMTMQETANAIGAALRDAEATAVSEHATATKAKLDILHSLLSQGCVDYLPDVDWYAAAGVKPPSTTDPHTSAGGTGKTKPQ